MQKTNVKQSDKPVNATADAIGALSQPLLNMVSYDTLGHKLQLY